MESLLTSLEPLIVFLRARGYTVIGPTESEGAIVLAELTDSHDLPHGWGVETAPGTYRLRRRSDQAAFGHSAGPQAWKRFLHPPREALFSAERTDDGMRFVEPETPVAQVRVSGRTAVRPTGDRRPGQGSRDWLDIRRSPA